MNFLTTVIAKLWYVWLAIISVVFLAIFSAVNLKKVKTNKIEECMSIYYEYEEIQENIREKDKSEQEKEKVLKEYLSKLQKAYETYKDIEYSDYLLLRQAEIYEELKQKDEAMKVYDKLQNSPYNCMPDSKGCTMASEIAGLIITRTNQNKQLWEKEILKNIYHTAEPKLVIVTDKITLKVKLKYSLFPDNVGFLINSIRNGDIRKVVVLSQDKDFIDLKIEGKLRIPANSYIQYEKPDKKELEGEKSFIMFKTQWGKNLKPQNIDYSGLRICKKCELQEVESYSVLGVVEGDIKELEKLQGGDESLSIFLEEAKIAVPMPTFLTKE